MSYGHAHNLSGSNKPPGPHPRPEPAPPVDPEWYDRADLRSALAQRDITTLYRALTAAGVTQRRIAQLTGQAQSEVSEILKGRKVSAYDVLARIADGLVIPRRYMGLSYGEDAYRGDVTDTTNLDEVLNMLRRHVLALGGLATFGATVPGLGKLLPHAPAPAARIAVPTRIGMSDIAVIRDHTVHLRTLSRTYGGQGAPGAALADWADEWLTAEAKDAVRTELLRALSELHTSVAWACHDSGAPARAYWHFGRAVELAHDAKDDFLAGYALSYTGNMLLNRDLPNDALKTVQMAELLLAGSPRTHAPAHQARCHALAARALCALNDGTESTRAQARKQLAMSQDGWQPPDAHAKGLMDLITGITHLQLGQLDTAEPLLSASAQTFKHAGERRDGVVAELVLATVYVRAGDPRALPLASDAISAVRRSQCGSARQFWLPPLAEALEAHPGGDAEDLARHARQLAAVA